MPQWFVPPIVIPILILVIVIATALLRLLYAWAGPEIIRLLTERTEHGIRCLSSKHFWWPHRSGRNHVRAPAG